MDEKPTPKPPTFAEQDEYSKKALLGYSEELNRVRILSGFKKTEAATRVKELEIQKKLIEEQFKRNILNIHQYKQGMLEANAAIQNAQKQSQTILTKMFNVFSTAASNDIKKIGKTLEDVLTTGSYIGIALWMLKMYDAQRMLKNWAGQTEILFGKAGKGGVERFTEGMLTTTPTMLKHLRYITTDLLLSYQKAMFESGKIDIFGLGIEKAGGIQIEDTREMLLLIGKSFGMTAEEMVNYRTTFKDVLGLEEEQVGNFASKITAHALAMAIPPKAALNITAGIVDQFKLLYRAGDDVVKVMDKFGKVFGAWGAAGTRTGGLATLEATKTLFTSLSSLGSDKLAGLIALAHPNILESGGIAAAVNKFYAIDKTTGEVGKEGNRYQLLMDAYTGLKRLLEFSGADAGLQRIGLRTFLTKELPGMTEPIAERLIDILDSSFKTGKTLSPAALQKQLEDLMVGVTPIEEQFMNFIMTSLGAIIRYLMEMAGHLAISDEAKALNTLLSDRMLLIEKTQHLPGPSEKGYKAAKAEVLALDEQLKIDERNYKNATMASDKAKIDAAIAQQKEAGEYAQKSSVGKGAMLAGKLYSEAMPAGQIATRLYIDYAPEVRDLFKIVIRQLESAAASPTAPGMQ